jgi:hypothetical protein
MITVYDIEADANIVIVDCVWASSLYTKEQHADHPNRDSQSERKVGNSHTTLRISKMTCRLALGRPGGGKGRRRLHPSHGNHTAAPGLVS